MRIDGTDIALGARIRVRRLQLNLSQEALAEALGVSYQQVQKYERGMDRISVTTLIRIARRLDCTVAGLIGEEAGSVHDSVAPHLAVPGALDLLDIYSKIGNAATRRRILDLLQDLAGSAQSATSPRKEWHAEPTPWRRGIKRNGAGDAGEAKDPPRPRGRPRKTGR